MTETAEQAMETQIRLVLKKPDCVAQSVACLTQEPDVLGSIPVRPHSLLSFSLPLLVQEGQLWRKYIDLVLFNRLGGLSQPRNSVVRLTDRPDMPTAVQYSQLSLSRLRLFRITAYLEEKIWSLL